MSVRTKVEIGLLGILALGCGLACLTLMRGGLSAREEPTSLEAFVVRRMRHLAVPRSARELANPVQPTPEVLAEARAHFADHCALCHGNDGKGQTEIGRNLYPKALDMQLEATQSLSDGELYYIIRNGVRLTGMPAWGTQPSGEDLDSWELVHFIRHLPEIHPEELEEMKSMNPVSRRELEEERQIERFLEGDEAPSSIPHHDH